MTKDVTKEFEEGFEAYTLQDLSDNPYHEGEGTDIWIQWTILIQWDSGWLKAESQDPLVSDDEDDDEDEDAEYEYA